jgi:hypothetical protein
MIHGKKNSQNNGKFLSILMLTVARKTGFDESCKIFDT